MQQTVEAIYENGGFRLIDPANLQLFEGQQVHLIIEPPTQSATNPLDLAAQVYEGLSDSQIEEIEQIARIESQECGHADNSFRAFMRIKQCYPTD